MQVTENIFKQNKDKTLFYIKEKYKQLFIYESSYWHESSLN